MHDVVLYDEPRGRSIQAIGEHYRGFLGVIVTMQYSGELAIRAMDRCLQHIVHNVVLIIGHDVQTRIEPEEE